MPAARAETLAQKHTAVSPATSPEVISPLSARVFLGIQPRVKKDDRSDFTQSLRSSYTGLYPQSVDSCITQLKAQGPSRTCNESKEVKKCWHGEGSTWRGGLRHGKGRAMFGYKKPPLPSPYGVLVGFGARGSYERGTPVSARGAFRAAWGGPPRERGSYVWM